MSLKKLVPTLGLLAAAAAPMSAVELLDGTLVIDGWVDTVFEYTRFDANAPVPDSYDNANIWTSQYRIGAYSVTNGGTGTLVVGYENWANPSSSYFTDPGSPSDGFPITVGGFGGLGNGFQPLSGAGPIATLSGGQISTFALMPNAESGSVADFAASAEIEVTWNISDTVAAQTDIRWDDANNFSVQEAFVSWDFAEGFNLQAGKYVNWLGWEAADPTGLYRVNTSLVAQSSLGVDVTGANVYWTPVDNDDIMFTVGAHIVDTIYGDPYGIKDGNDLGFGLDATLDFVDAVTLGLDLMLDKNATYSKSAVDDAFQSASITPALTGGPVPPGGYAGALWANPDGWREDVFGIGLNVEVDALRNSTGLLFAGDLQVIDYDLASSLALMGMVNWQFHPNMSGTFMASYLDANDEDSSVTIVPGPNPGDVWEYWQYNGENDEQIQLALALLTNPTGSEYFAANFELQYTIRDDLDVAPGGSLYDLGKFEKRNDIGFFVELLAVIP